ncbi:PTS sugar transporter subunit IIB [Fusobacterium sp.]|jgi:PTS system cellobiose-specific IIB component|uniref:PTS sugar transporter subunit IIB n=1 Tax=Fusobacterium sp. TaxID=68766 RepID=UPI0015A66AE4|nr:PTS sugar transporter subunit IIB [Fusobacterium sp.]MDY2980741.1 PTS sugar transporter subunit IIB [Fusobacterium sp.]
MKKILLCCSAGMSTSLLVTKMRKVAEERGLDVEIEAVALELFDENLPKYDIFLLGPQVKFKKTDFQKKADEYGKKVEVINMIDYGTMNGAKVLDFALNLIK